MTLGGGERATLYVLLTLWGACVFMEVGLWQDIKKVGTGHLSQLNSSLLGI